MGNRQRAVPCTGLLNPCAGFSSVNICPGGTNWKRISIFLLFAQVRHIGFSTGWGSVGEFKIWRKEDSDENHNEAFTLGVPHNTVPGSERATAFMIGNTDCLEGLSFGSSKLVWLILFLAFYLFIYFLCLLTNRRRDGSDLEQPGQTAAAALWLWGAKHDPLCPQRLCSKVPAENQAAQPRGGERGHRLPAARSASKNMLTFFWSVYSFYKLCDGVYSLFASQHLM